MLCFEIEFGGYPVNSCTFVPLRSTFIENPFDPQLIGSLFSSEVLSNSENILLPATSNDSRNCVQLVFGRLAVVIALSIADSFPTTILCDNSCSPEFVWK